MSISQETLSTQRESTGDTGGRVATAGSLFGALAMTSCCILPLVLVSLGVGGVWIAQLTALYAYKWYTFTFAAGFIAWGFWKVHRAEAGECRDGTVCARPVNRRIMKASLWLATVVTAVAIVFPYVAPYVLRF
jgi:mercuric ion transport protein|tara:strand:- start:10842 stop:11240 length:399 start_codon:yes stop_codon:yes gene_type:complete